MNKIIKLVFITISCLLLSLPLALEASLFSSLVYKPHIGLGLSTNDEPSAGTAQMFIPLWQTPNNLTFFQSNFSTHNNFHINNPNITFGYRQLDPTGNFLWGAAASYNGMSSTIGNKFQQISLNGDMWYKKWHVDSNLYLPIGNTTQRDDNPQNYQLVADGDYQNIFYQTGYQSAMSGVDVMFGRTVWRNLTLSAGGYTYAANNIKNLNGFKWQGDYSWYATPQHSLLFLFNKISIDAGSTQVAYGKNKGYIGVTFSIMPFGKQDTGDGVITHMTDDVANNPGVVVGAFKTETKELKNADGTPTKLKQVSNLQQLEQAIADPNANVIAVNGTINGLDDLSIDRSLTLTGKNYTFHVGGETYTMPVVADDGGLSAAAGKNLLEIANTTDQNRSITIEDLNMQVDSNSNLYLVHSPGTSSDSSTPGTQTFMPDDGSLGNVSLLNNNGNGRIALGAGGNNNTATITLTGNNLNLDDYDAGSSDMNGAINITAANGAHVVVKDLSSNSVKASRNQIIGIENTAIGDGSQLNITGAISNNAIENFSYTMGSSSIGISNMAINDANFNITGPMNKNNIDVTDQTATGILNFSNNNSNLNISGSTNDNSIDTGGIFTGLSYGIVNSVNKGTLTISGAISNNTITGGYLQSIGIDNIAKNEGTINLAGAITNNSITTYSSTGGLPSLGQGISFDADNSKIEATGGIYNNSFNLYSQFTQGFYFQTANNATINIKVNDPKGRGLSAANNNATLSSLPDGVTITP